MLFVRQLSGECWHASILKLAIEINFACGGGHALGIKRTMPALSRLSSSFASLATSLPAFVNAPLVFQ